jgi:predicted component of type VI protein secretion system
MTSTFSGRQLRRFLGRAMPAQLLALTEGPSILLDKPVLLIGRHPECDIQIDSRKVSRRHCCIAQVTDYLVVRDLGSTNGIRINGIRVMEGRLRPGDELTIGNSRYQVRWDEAGAGAAVPRPARQPARQVLADDLLERCEDPIPLEEEDSPRLPARARVKTALPKEAPPEKAAKSPPSPPPESPPPRILPEELELAPASDVFPAPSPSHPPD